MPYLLGSRYLVFFICENSQVNRPLKLSLQLLSQFISSSTLNLILRTWNQKWVYKWIYVIKTTLVILDVFCCSKFPTFYGVPFIYFKSLHIWALWALYWKWQSGGGYSFLFILFIQPSCCHHLQSCNVISTLVKFFQRKELTAYIERKFSIGIGSCDDWGSEVPWPCPLQARPRKTTGVVPVQVWKPRHQEYWEPQFTLPLPF